MKAEIGLVNQTQLMTGTSELSYMAFMPEEQRRLWLRGRLREPGLLLSPRGSGNMGRAWQVEHLDPADPLIIRFERQVPTVAASINLAVTQGGDVIALEVDPTDAYYSLDTITVPDDGVWRTLVVKYATTNYEPGTLQFTAGDKTVLGTGTKFSRLGAKTGDGLLIGDKFVTPSGLNAGVYWVVDSVTSDTELEMTVAAAANQSGATFRVTGSYYQNDIPATPSAHLNPVVTFELKSGVVLPDPDTYLILADVMLDSGVTNKIQILDRRYANILRMLPHGTAPMRSCSIGRVLAPESVNSSTFTNDYNFQELRAESRPVLEHDVEVYWTSLAPTSDGLGMIAVITTSGYIRVVSYDPKSGTWPAWDTTPGVRPDTSGDPDAATVEALPKVYGNTHILVYALPATGAIKSRFSTNDGASWGAEGSIITDADYYDGASSPPVVFLARSGRLFVFYPFSDGATTAGVRVVYSDNYGGTWTSDSGIGFDSYESGGTGASTVPYSVCEMEDGRLAVLCRDSQDIVMDPNVMGVLFTASNVSYAWDAGDTIGGSAPTFMPTVRVTDRDDVPPFYDVSLCSASIVALPNGCLAIFHSINDPDVSGICRGHVTVVNSESYRIDPEDSSRLTLEIQQHSEINWCAITTTGGTRPQMISARMMPGGLIPALLTRKRSVGYRMDQHTFQVIDAPLTFAPHPSTFTDLNP